MGIYEKVKDLQTNKKIIGGCLTFLFFPPLFFAYLTLYSYREIKNGTVNGLLTLLLGGLTLLSTLPLISITYGLFTYTPKDSSPAVITGVEKPEEVIIDNPVAEKLPEDQMTFKVLSVTDGDTVRIEYYGESTPVRFIGVDAPEINHQSEPVQCYGPEAKKYLEDQLLNKWVKLEKEVKDDDKDKYGRLLRYIILEDGTNLGERGIKKGFLLESTYTEGYKYQELYRSAQKEAQSSQIGFWDPRICNGDVYTGTYKDPAKVAPTPVSEPDPVTERAVPEASNTGGSGYVAPVVPQKATSGSYVCNCSKSCTKMSSCEEAYYQLNTCGCSARDGDDDGVPCEALCK